jgi:adenosylcobinamide-GDP ribazoletransferase
MSYRNDGERDRRGIAAWVSDFRLSLSFLSRLPVSEPREAEPREFAAAMRAFPLAGAAVGLLAGLAFAVALGLGIPPLVAALLAVAAGLLITGALHEDGLADLADGLGGGTPEEALALMRDSRIGSFGVVALILALALKAAALAAIAAGPGGGWAGFLSLLAAGAWSRAIPPALLHALPPARPDGLALRAGTPSRAVVAQAAVAAWLIGLAALWPVSVLLGLLALPAASLLAGAGIGWLADRRVGGHTGDVLGAAVVAGEALCLIACAWALAP